MRWAANVIRIKPSAYVIRCGSQFIEVVLYCLQFCGPHLINVVPKVSQLKYRFA